MSSVLITVVESPLLKALAYGTNVLRFLPRERQLLLSVLATGTVPSARRLAAQLGRRYTHVKADVRALVACHRRDFSLEWLPPSAPDFNPEALGNGAVKRELANAVPLSIEALHRQARRGFQRLGRRPEILTHVFDHAGLCVTGAR